MIHWVGGVHTELRLPKRRRGQRNATPDDIVDAVRQLVLIANDDLIAGILNRNGLTTGHGNRWTRERVTALRSHHKIPVFRPQRTAAEPWLNLSKAARYSASRRRRFGWPPKPARSRASILYRMAHGSSAVPNSRSAQPRQIVHRARQNPKYPAGSHPDQQSLFSSMT